MNLSDYLKPRGKTACLSRLIGAHQPDVSRWADGSRPVPIHRCIAIEEATNGLVTRKDLRPDWREIWPEFKSETA